MGSRTPKTSRRRGVQRTAPPLQIRLTVAERAALEAKAAAAGITLSDFVRQHIGKAQVVNRDDWRRAVYLLSNLTNNLNQVARWANTYKDAADALAVVSHLVSIERQARQLSGVLERGQAGGQASDLADDQAGGEGDG